MAPLWCNSMALTMLLLFSITSPAAHSRAPLLLTATFPRPRLRLRLQQQVRLQLQLRSHLQPPQRARLGGRLGLLPLLQLRARLGGRPGLVPLLQQRARLGELLGLLQRRLRRRGNPAGSQPGNNRSLQLEHDGRAWFDQWDRSDQELAIKSELNRARARTRAR